MELKVLVCPECGCMKNPTVEHYGTCKNRPEHVAMLWSEYVASVERAMVLDRSMDLCNEIAALRAEVAQLKKERDALRALLLRALLVMAAMRDLIRSACPDASSWCDSGGIADRYDVLEGQIGAALKEEAK